MRSVLYTLRRLGIISLPHRRSSVLAVGCTTYKGSITYSLRREFPSTATPILDAKENAHITTTTSVSTLRTALELKSIFDQLQAAEAAGSSLSPEERKRLEESAAEKGLQALFKGAKLEIEGVLRDVCDRVLSGDNPPPSSSLPSSPSSPGFGNSASMQQVQRRGGSGADPRRLALKAKALLILGEAYMAAREDGEAESEYVRVETNASRERERDKMSRG